MKKFVEIILVILTYFVFARIGQLLAIEPGNVTPVWLPAGLLLPWVYKRGLYLWPGVFFGAFIGNVWAYLNLLSFNKIALVVLAGAFNGVGDVFSIVGAAYVLKKIVKKDTPLHALSHVSWFLVFGVIVGPFLSALFGVSGLLLAQKIPLEIADFVLMTWWTGDSISVVVIAPLIFGILNRNFIMSKEHAVECSLSFLGLLSSLVCSHFLLEVNINITLFMLLVVPFLIWSTIRINETFVFAQIIFTSFFSIICILNGVGPFVEDDKIQSLIQLQLFLGILSVTILYLNAMTYKLKEYQLHLEDIINERTKELVSAREEAVFANMAKSQFLATMSHEIRTPLNTLLGMGELLGETELSSTQSRYLTALNSSGKHLHSLMNDILDISKIESGKLELDLVEFNLKSLTNDLEVLFSNMAKEKGLSFLGHYDDELSVYFKGDVTRIRQILYNVLGNAVKFTSKGEISFSSMKSDDDQVQFVISDTGIGISQDEIDNIFEAFRQSDSSITRKFGGTGLGLSICKKLVDLLSGSIKVKSQLGIGSSFIISVPLESLTHTLKTKKDFDVLGNKNIDETVLANKKVLVVDDAPDNCSLIDVFLSKSGMHVDQAFNGQEGVAKTKKNKYDIIIMDIQMPELDGHEALKIIRMWEQSQNLPKTPVFAFTAQATTGESESIINSGFDLHLVKPVQKQFLISTLVKYFNQQKMKDAS